ncbi:ADI_G0007230.mRNA.1.CDS.1 [Saccharomyces cerevisiae]|nr:ADI_G0007230.mRNA.1.CDS.1 [Saccharomyces cerevisiae]CAI6534467.1 ADI_G0007230.mRNA.1.CDS.1 [Saccharomyces cerevisiae]
MPAKLQLDILRTPQSSACHGTQTLKNFQFLERLYNDLQKYCSTSVFDSRKLLHTLKYNFDLPSRHRKTSLLCLPLVESNTLIVSLLLVIAKYQA